MAYADQKMSTNKLVALIIVALLHVLVGYALVTGLAYSAVKKLKERVETFDVKEEKPPEEPPPPPPDQPENPPPPIVAPPPAVQLNAPASQVQTVQEAAPLPPAPVFTAAPPAPPAPPPAPPAPKFSAKPAAPKGNPGDWATSDDYPARALREEREGTTRFRVTVGPDGKVTDCQVTASSGSPDLDEAACKNITRRARFAPAVDTNGSPTTGSYSNAIRWVIPKG
jgi:protein TonB